ncbi:type II toxin-antitoxin system toxin DNA ADP-ribosyl transferase DarT [Planococcus kocurii]|uniref:type II toxin-antitoxin system toxin DNA ADP-ribosyl transferase DarT n=1 Tax=Planococcus kocurii TaxID=1374 RepID=UPI003CFE46AC
METNKLRFHMTHIKNLPSILKNQELLAYSEMALRNTLYQDIANPRIQERRFTTSIRLAPHGSLHEYVPFYFAACSPMLYSVLHNGTNQEEMVYLVTDTETIDQSGVPYLFTDGHAIMVISEFYSDLTELNKIDWPLMEDPDRKRRRQAEFLVHKKVPIQLFTGFAVINQLAKDRVEELLKNHQVNKPVGIRRHFYYK